MPAFDPNTDYYELLQVHPQAHQQVVKRAYRTILSMLRGHPDLGGNHEIAIRIIEAYRVLSDPATRQAYDEARGRQQSARTAAPAPQEVGRVVRGIPAHGELVVCPRCGALNPLPTLARPRHVYCGRCHSPLPRSASRRREGHVPIEQAWLTAEEEARLLRTNELCLLQVRVTTSGHLCCLRCRAPLLEETLPPPARCPRCGSRHWNTLRLFRCGYCRHQFATTSLRGWPYWLYPECPACHRPQWHQGCERHPLRWVWNLFNLPGAAHS